MLTEVKMPQLGLTMAEGMVTKWFFQEGDTVKAGDELLELTTDKLTSAIESPCDGTLLKVYVPAENEVPVGTLLAVLGEAGEQVPEASSIEYGQPSLSPPDSSAGHSAVVPEAAAVTAVQTDGRVKASPLARKLALEKGVSIEQIPGTGPGGRVVKKDVDNFVPADAGAEERSSQSDLRPLAGMRKVIAERMWQSWNMSPHVTLNREVDMSELNRIKDKLSAAGQKSSYTEFIVKACAVALMEMPEVNRSLIDGVIYTHNTADIGVATALPDGLIVPVVKDVQTKSVSEIRAVVKDLSQRARQGKATASELTGGTFTVSNLGMYGIDTFTPIINPPESAILGVNRVVKKPVVVEADGNDAIEIRPMMNLSLSIDHRLVDGAIGAIFMQKLALILENPYLLF